MAFLNILRVALVSTLLLTSVNAACVSPKVRREWRSISSAERASWIQAIKCLAKLPHNPNIVPTVNPALSLIPPITADSSYLDDFSYIHMDLNVLIHGTGLFFPWHRLFVQAFEDELRSKCGYNGVHPYWNWTQDAADVEHSTILCNSTVDGLGSWGDPANDFQIFTGALKDIRFAYPIPHNIRRNYTIQPLLEGFKIPGAQEADPLLMINTSFTQSNVEFIVNSFTGEYVNFQAYIESISGPSAGPNLIIGGDLSGLCPSGLAEPDCYPGPKWTPNDPLFYLHQAMIDKIWYDWQLRDPSNKNAFGGGSISAQVDPSQASTYPTGAPPFLNLTSAMPGDGLWEDVTVQDVMDTQGERLCYIYA